MKKATGIISEFKQFISRGNVMDLAVGVIIGGAFTSIVNSLVNDVIMPIIGVICGGVDFTGLRLVISPASGDTAEVAICYGNFIQSVINFLIIALVVFAMIKLLSRFHRKKEKEEAQAAPAQPPADIVLLTEIRDLLANANKEEN